MSQLSLRARAEYQTVMTPAQPVPPPVPQIANAAVEAGFDPYVDYSYSADVSMPDDGRTGGT